MSLHSLWAYPWDIADLGQEEAEARIRATGAGMVSLATSYHAGRFLQPGNPRRRIHYPQDGTIYYRPDPALWDGAGIRPLMADSVLQDGAVAHDLARARAEGGLALSCWTVCLHNTRLGMAHPAHVVRTALGDPQFYGLCPSSPAARDYVRRLVADIGAALSPDRIELESPDFMGFSHGYHHEKDGLGLLEEEDLLLSLCFCDHCRARAEAAGLPFEAARRTVADLLLAAFERALPEPQFPDFPARGIAAFDDLTELAAFLRWRSEPVTSLVAEAREAAPPGTEVLVIDFAGSWRGGVDPAACARACDGLLYCAYTTPAAEVAAQIGAMRAVIGPDKRLIAGFQMFHPEVSGPEDQAARAAGAAMGGADALNFYNLGLVPPARLAWARRAVEAFAANRA